MDELRKIKAELSVRYNSQTPEERKLDAEEAMKIAESYLGRPIETVDYSKHRKEELAQA
jgi:hypothetical protein